MYTHAFRRASNRATWTWNAALTNPSSGSAIDLTGATIKIAISEQDADTPLITGSTTDGKVVIGTPATGGTFAVTFPRSAMVDLDEGPYDVGLTVTLASGVTHQLVIATLPVLGGVVAA